MEYEPLPNVLKALKNKSAFIVPADYFKELYQRVYLSLYIKVSNTSPNEENVPEDYFNKFSSRLIDRIENETLQACGINNSHGFKVPSGYFEANLVRCQKLGQPAFKWKKITAYAVAAIVILLLGIGIMFQMYNNKIGQPGSVFAGVSEEELLEYVHENLEEFEPMAIAELLDHEALEEIQIGNEEMKEEELENILEEL